MVLCAHTHTERFTSKPTAAIAARLRRNHEWKIGLALLVGGHSKGKSLQPGNLEPN